MEDAQRVARTVDLNGIPVVLRIQMPLEEDPVDVFEQMGLSLPEGVEIEGFMEYDPTLVIEAWCDATQSVLSFPVTKEDSDDIEDFVTGMKFLMNGATEEQALDIIKTYGLDKVINMVCRGYKVNFVEPTVKDKK